MPRRKTIVESDVPLFLIPHTIMKRIRIHGEETESVVVRKSRRHFYNISIRTKPVKRELKPRGTGRGTPVPPGGSGEERDEP